MPPRDVVQLRAPHRWAGALAFVEEERPWGLIVFVAMPTNDGEPPGQAFTRAVTGEYRLLAPAAAIWPPDQVP